MFQARYFDRTAFQFRITRRMEPGPGALSSGRFSQGHSSSRQGGAAETSSHACCVQVVQTTPAPRMEAISLMYRWVGVCTSREFPANIESKCFVNQPDQLFEARV